MKKRITSLFIVLAIMLTMVPFGTVFASESIAFSDVSEDAWYKKYVDYVKEQGIMNGVSEDSFLPEENLTRAMFVTILGRFAKAEVDEDAKAVFTDVEEGIWYAPYVKWAYENKIANGVTETEFAPDASVTREQVAVLISRYLRSEGYALVTSAAKAFADADSISEYAAKDITRCQNAAIMSGNADNTFLPQKNITRAEAAAVISKIADYVELNSKTTILNEADKEIMAISFSALQNPQVEGINLAKDHFRVAFTRSFSVTGTADEILDQVYNIDFENVTASQESALKMVVHTLYGGADIENQESRYFGGEKKKTIVAEDFIMGDLFVYDSTLLIFNGENFITLDKEHKEISAKEVLAEALKAKRYVVLRPSYTFAEFNHYEEDFEGENFTPEQKAIIQTAKNYVLRGYRTQYEDTRFLSGSDYRWQIGVKDIEDYTLDDTGYTNCAAFVTDVYRNAIGFETLYYQTSDYNKAKELQKFFYEPTGKETDEEKAKIEKEFREILQPGDAINYRRASSGHIVLYIGNNKYIHSSGSVFNYSGRKETYEPSIRYRSLDDLFGLETIDASNSMFSGSIKQISIIRPEGTVTESAKTRMEKLQGVVAEKLTSNNTEITVSAGDTIEYIFSAYNTNDYEVTIDITDEVPENTTYVSGAEKVNGNKLSWQIKVPAGETIKVSYIVTADKDGSIIESKKATMNGVPVKAQSLFVRNTLTEEDGKKVTDATYSAVKEDANEIARANKIYKDALGKEAVFTQATLEELKEAIWVTGEDNKIRLNNEGQYRSMVVPTLWGGRKLYTERWEFKLGAADYRTELVREKNLVKGDIIATYLGEEGTLYVYTGADKLVNLKTGEEITNITPFLDALICDDLFAVLRPSTVF